MSAQSESIDFMIQSEPQYIIIKGLTEDGRRFRPSDWAERLATAVARVDYNRRIRFHPKVRIATQEGVKSVLIDPALEDDEPMLFDFLMNFARENSLQVESGISTEELEGIDSRMVESG